MSQARLHVKPAAAVILALSLMGVAACSGSPSGGSTAPETTSEPAAESGSASAPSDPAEAADPCAGEVGSSGEVTLTFAASIFGDPGTGPKMQAMLDDFNEDCAGKIKVEPAAVPFQTIGQTTMTQMAGGLGPDIIRLEPSYFYQAEAADLLAPLDIDAETYGLTEATDKYMFGSDGERYGIVFQQNTYALIYNPDLVETPPTTFDEFYTLAKELTHDGVYGYAVRTTLPEQAGMWQDLCNYVYGNGGSWSDGKNLTLTSDEVVTALEEYQKMVDSGAIPQGATASAYRTMFTQGKVAMMIDSAGLVNTLLGMDPNTKIAAARSPFPDDAQGMVLTPLVINKNSKHIEESEAFLRWLLKPENQARIQNEVVPVGVAAIPPQRTDADLEARPYIPAFDDAIPYAVPQTIQGLETKSVQLQDVIIKAVIEALQSHGDMRAAMESAQQQAQAVING